MDIRARKKIKNQPPKCCIGFNCLVLFKQFAFNFKLKESRTDLFALTKSALLKTISKCLLLIRVRQIHVLLGGRGNCREIISQFLLDPLYTAKHHLYWTNMHMKQLLCTFEQPHTIFLGFFLDPLIFIQC